MAEKRKRKPMKPPSDALRGWSAALRSELERWPQVELKSSFGMVMAYRGETIFAALPGTRAFYAEDAIMLKINKESKGLAGRIAAEPRFVPGAMHTKGGREGHKWHLLALRSDADVHGAIEWLAEAYQAAGKRRK
jgi:hypothetical protein